MTLPNLFHLETADGIRLAGREWRPHGEAEHHVLLVHGYGEHLGRYEYLGECLAEQGVRTVGVDLRGHGLSKGQRGHVTRWSDYGRDVSAVAELMPPKCTLLAHSMGGLIALDWLRENQEAIGNLILSGPLVGEAVANPAWKKAMATALSRILPWVPVASGIPLEDLSTDADEVALFERDSLRVKTVTPRWFTEMHAAMARAWKHLPQYSTPLHLHVAGDERIIDRPSLDRLYEGWPAAKERWIWEGGRHEILKEPFREGVVAAMLEGIRG